MSEKKTLKHLAAALFEEMLALSEKAKAAESADETLKYAQAQAQLAPLVRYFADKLIENAKREYRQAESLQFHQDFRDTECEQSRAEEL